MSATTSSNSSVRNKHSSSNNHYNAPSIDITKEELSRISDALKNEEFRKLFLDYCEEIQDPVNRQRYENEVTQFEAERGVEVKFLNPEPGFVIKTSVDGAYKCFVNVAKSVQVAKPSSEACFNAETGTRGLNWAIPMAQSAPREDLDAHGKRCRVFDVIFNPDALYLAQRNAAFHKILVDTALDAVEREYKVNLDRTNLKFPKMQFKGVARPTVIRKLAKDAPADADEPHPLENIYPAKPRADAGEPTILPLKTKTSEQPEYNIPKYSIKYRRDVDLAEYTNELDAKLNVTMPCALIVEIELPLLHSTSECQLDVTQKALFLLSEKLGARYRLNIDLPHEVNDKQGSARFESDTRRLCITLPVVQQSAKQQRSMHDVLLQLNREDSGVESDVRDEVISNRESPVEELSDNVEDNAATMPQTDEPIASVIVNPATFLKSSIHYKFPAKFDCNVLDNVMSLVLHVRNVQRESINMVDRTQSIHLQFTSIGAGYYPTHYSFYLQLPSELNVRINFAVAEAWENNVVLNLHLASMSENLHNYFAGIDGNDLKAYSVQGKFFGVVRGSRQRKKSPLLAPQISYSSSLDISVERSDCEQSIEIEIKPRPTEEQSTCAANTTEDEDNSIAAKQQQCKKSNKKQKKKKDKKRRSLSETAFDDIKTYQKNQQEANEAGGISKHFSSELRSANTPLLLAKVEETGHDMQVTGKHLKLTESVDVPMGTAQQRKQRSYSECRDSVNSSNGGPPSSFKGILKRFSRYEPRPSISDSNSSIDDCFSSYSCSADAGVASSLRFSQSFSDIPEENVSSELSESCKKTVRFNEVINKQVFRLHSSILGQRKKNQKRRNKKQRALQRRLSEGDSVDYEDIKPDLSETNNKHYFNRKEHNKNSNDLSDRNTKELSQHDSGLDLSNGTDINEKNKFSKNGHRRVVSESYSDIDHNKNSMMFEMDM